MAKLKFGEVEENVVTRDEFPLKKALEVLKDDVVAVLGYGVQGAGQAMNLRDTLEGTGTKVAALGLTVAQADGAVRDRFGLGADVEGVVITEIDANGPADDKPIRVGDVIVDIGQRKVEKVADIEAAIKEARDAGRKSVLLLVRTGDDSRFVAIRLKD